MRNGNVPDILEHMSCFAGGDGVRDIQVNPGLIWLGYLQFTGLVVIVAVLIGYFELGKALSAEFFFSGVEGAQLLLPVWASAIVAFVDGDLFALFPCKEGFETIRTEVFIRLAKPDMQLEDIMTNLAFQLSSFLTVVEIDILVWSTAIRTSCFFRHTVFRGSDIDGLEGFSVFGFIFSQQCCVI